MANRPPSFTEHEAVLLLDTYLQYTKSGISFQYFSKRASADLRQMALNQGMEIDDRYRNEAGIATQMRNMEHAFNGKGVNWAKASRLFRETVALYRNNRAEFDRLLQEAQNMVAGTDDNTRFHQNQQVEPNKDNDRNIQAKSNLSLDIRTAMKDCFEGPAYRVYLQCLFERFKVRMQDELKVSDASELQKMIQPYWHGEFNSQEKYYWIEEWGDDYRGELEEFFENASDGVTEAELRSRYWFMPYAVLQAELKQNKSIQVLGDGLFCHVDYMEKLTKPRKPIASQQPQEVLSVRDGGADLQVTVDLSEAHDFSFTKPISFAYFEEAFAANNWRELYANCCKLLWEDYPTVFNDLCDDSSFPYFCWTNSLEAKRMITPLEIGNQILVEGNLSANNLIRQLRDLMDRCNVDYENLTITLIRKKQGSQSKPIQQQEIALPASPLSEPLDTNCPAQDGSSGEIGIIRFMGWMRSKKYADRTVMSYVSALKNVEKFAKEHDLIQQDIFLLTQTRTLRKLGQTLTRMPDFIELNRMKHNALSASLRQYLEFCENAASGLQDMTEQQTMIEEMRQSEKPVVAPETGNRFNSILADAFPDGLRLKGMRLRKFRSIYQERYGQVLEPDDGKLAELLKRACDFREERVYAKPDARQSTLLNAIEEACMALLSAGASGIYLKQLFERYRNQLAAELSVYTPQALAALLCGSGKPYVLWDDVLCLRGKVCDPASDVLQFFQNNYEPVTYEQLQQALWYIPFERIKQVLFSEPDLANVAGSTYFYVYHFPITAEELAALRQAMNREIEEKGFLVAKSLCALMETYCPNAWIDAGNWKDWGIRNVFSRLLRDSFNFNGVVICAKGSNADTHQIFRSYCKTHSTATLDELKTLCSQLDVSAIYWDSVYSEMVRVSKTNFVSRSDVHFDIEAVDQVLSQACPGDYMPLRDFNLFMTLPGVGYPWNGFLLESFLRGYSRVFRLEQASPSEQTFIGAMVRRGCPIRSEQDLYRDVLSHDDTWNNEKEALSVLVERGYRTQRKLSSAPEILRAAKALRRQRQEAEK